MTDCTDIPNSVIVEAVKEYVKGERNRLVLIDRLINQMCYEPLAEKYDISVSTVRRIIYKYECTVLSEARKATKKKLDYAPCPPLRAV